MCTFAELLELIASIDGIDRIRYTTSHPVEFTDDIIDAYATIPELVDHLHLPVQSGADRILNLMKRGHTAIEYKSKIRRLKKETGMSILVIDKSIRELSTVADQAVILEKGVSVWSGNFTDLTSDITDQYLGV